MNIEKLPILCGKHIRQMRAIDEAHVPVVDKVPQWRAVLDDSHSCRLCKQVQALYAGYRRRGWRSCLLCGARFEDNKQRLKHEEQHPLPPEAEPPVGCDHAPLGIRIGHRRASVLEQGKIAIGTQRQWDLWALPEVMLRVIEEENGGSVHRTGWYYARTRQTEVGLEDLWHHPTGAT